MGSVRAVYRPLGPNFDPTRRGFRGNYIYAFWHEHMLMPAYLYGQADIHVLISRHADGQLIAEIVERLGFRTVRGSTTRGGVEALREMVKLGRTGHLAITPDGPRGPRRQVQPGVVYLASRTGLPVVPFSYGYERAWRAKSWDRFAVPRPFSKAVCVSLDPIFVPPDVGPATLEPYRLQIESALAAASLIAERWAATGHFDPSPAMAASAPGAIAS
jgi:lysophospholipid acyltransferase (LPLAT)-like uncharacterized protein